MTYLILLIIILTMSLYFIYKDYLKILRITGIVTVSSGILTFGIGSFFKYFMKQKLSIINVSDVINIIVSEFVFNGICLLLLGVLELIFYFAISYVFDKKKELKNV